MTFGHAMDILLNIDDFICKPPCEDCSKCTLNEKNEAIKTVLTMAAKYDKLTSLLTKEYPATTSKYYDKGFNAALNYIKDSMDRVTLC